MYYKIIINKTSKPLNSKENFTCFDNEEIKFKTLKEVKEFLKENYQGKKKQKMFIDTKDGETKQAGYIYTFRNQDFSHMSEKWTQQDWVEVREVEEKTILTNF